jgi:hypothetical protein
MSKSKISTRPCLCGCGGYAPQRAAFIQHHQKRRWTYEVQTQAQVEALVAIYDTLDAQAPFWFTCRVNDPHKEAMREIVPALAKEES